MTPPAVVAKNNAASCRFPAIIILTQQSKFNVETYHHPFTTCMLWLQCYFEILDSISKANDCSF